MKLRDFVANSLPRVRGRKKKGQSVTGAAASITAVVVAAAATSTTTSATSSPARSPPTADDEDVLRAASSKPTQRRDSNGNWFQFAESRFSFLEKLVGKESPVKRLFEPKERHAASAAKAGGRRENRACAEQKASAEKPCRRSEFDSSNPYGSAEVVTSCAIGDRPVFYSQHASPVCGSWSGSQDRLVQWDSASVCTNGAPGYPDSLASYDSTPGSQRGPRSRSRIRTNPWLPSPRPSPYSVRSFSSPCTSSRSPSPSSSPAPHSSSDSTSPLTSFSSDVSESQLQRHRRHRRHHSEINASELTRQVLFDAPLTDTEQYYSAVDSGIADVATSGGERDQPRTSTCRKQRHATGRRRTGERDCQPYRTSPFTASSSPRSKPKFRARTRSSHPPCRGRIANRDSRSWDSDSSSRSPPRNCSGSPCSPRVEDRDCVRISNRGLSDHILQREDVVRGCSSGELLSESLVIEFGSRAELEEASVLSPCDDICVITSNIEQLAHNISSEYEDSGDVSFESTSSSLRKEDRSCSSLTDLINIDAEDSVLFQREDLGLCSQLDYTSFAEALQCRDFLRLERRSSQDTLLDTTLTDLSQLHTGPGELLPSVDVAVQTDFVDEDEEENSGSDWLASPESGSDWVTSNGSGSDWPVSGGSGCDWMTGEGSGCATEEEGEEEEESAVWEEGSRVWIVPDIMQNSTDTGYSSLSRDGRVVHDCDNNNSSSNATTANNTNAEDSSSSVSAADDKAARTSANVSGHNTSGIPKKRGVSASGAIPKAGHRQTHEAQLTENVDDEQRLRSQQSLDALGLDICSFGAMLRPDSYDDYEFCSCEASISDKAGSGEDASCHPFHDTSRAVLRRCADYNNVIPYPYDVTRFGDVILPLEQRQGSVSPCLPDSPASARWDVMQTSHRRPPPVHPLSTSTPRYIGSDVSEDDFCSCFPPDMTSLIPDVIAVREVPACVSREGLGLCRSPHLAPVQRHSGRRTTSSLCQDLPSTGRTLLEVKASLEDKVEVLRQGRRLVSRKIREAREEEMVRQQQKLRFQRLLDIHKKRILLETLQDLRQRLESQSARLQASYSAVLDLQKRYA